MTFNRQYGLEWSNDTAFFSLDFIDHFSQNSSFFNQNSVDCGKNELHQLFIGVETLDDIEKGIDDGLGVIINFLALYVFVLLGDSEEVLDGLGFEEFLMFLEVVEAHFDSSGDFTKGLFLHVEAHRVMMVAFGLSFHAVSEKILQNVND